MNVARSSFVMFLGTLVSRMLGLVRSPLLFAIAVGVNYPGANAFDIANRLPTLIYMLVAGGVVNAVLVPAIVRSAKRDSDGGAAYINKLVTLGLTILGGITILLTLVAPLLVRLFASGLTGDWYNLAVIFAYLCIPQVFFYGMYTLLGQILNAKENFGPYMWAPALNNVVAIAGLILIIATFGKVDPSTAWSLDSWPQSKIWLLGGSATLGIVAQALILLVPLRRIGVRLAPDFAFRGAGLGSAARSGAWVLMSLAFGMIPTVLISNVASSASDRATLLPPDQALGVAGNAAYTAAYSLYSLPTSLVVVSIVTAMFTRMATSAAKGDMSAVRADTSLALRVVAVFSFLATALIIVFAVPAVRIITPGSSWAEVQSIAAVLTAMSFGLVGVGSFTAIQRVYYAMEMARALFIVQIPFVILQSLLILATLTFPIDRIVIGVGVSMAVANTLTPIAALIRLRGRLGGLDARTLLATYAKLALAALVTTAAGWGILHLWSADQTSFIAAITQILIVAPICVIVFVAVMKVMRMEELAPLTRILSRITGKLRRTQAPVPTTLKSTSMNGGHVNGRTAGQRLRDRYELISPLESPLSSSIEAWIGTDTVLGTNVRILLIDAANPDRDHMIDSARRGVFVDDVRLIKILSIFDEDEYSAIVTEIPAGRRLADFLESGPIRHDQARAIVGETAGALDAGVRKGVRHRALSPDLVLIDSTGSIFVDGLGIDPSATLAGSSETTSSDLDRADARRLTALLASCLLGRHVTGDDDEALTEASKLDIPAELSTLLTSTAAGDGAVSTGDFIRTVVPWGNVDPAQLPEPAPLPENDSVDTPAEPAPELTDTANIAAVEAQNSTDETTAVPATPPPPPSFAVKEPQHWEASPSWDELSSEPSNEEKGLKPKFILIGALLLVLIFGLIAIRTLTRGTDPVELPTPTASATVEEPEATQPEETTEEPTEEATEELAPPEIASVRLLNPQADLLNPATAGEQDAPQDVPNIIDSDPATVWSSWWYSDPGFWMKEGIGLEVTLAAEANVTDVVLNVNGEGGLVQWRNTGADAPNTGDVIAEGAMTAETVLTAAEPVTTQTVVLWFEDLPTAPDGQYRIEISELSVR